LPCHPSPTRYIAGIPASFAYVLFRHRRGIHFDQSLKRKGEGESQLTNPYVFLRRRYGKLYSDYKPEYSYYKLVLMGRKFLFAAIIGGCCMHRTLFLSPPPLPHTHA
jgi:hypothetical protein